MLMYILERNNINVRTSKIIFQDLSEKESTYIAKLYSLGIVNGYNDGTFKPYKPITHAKFNGMIVRKLEILKKSEWKKVPLLK